MASTFETYSDRPKAPTITKHHCERSMTLPSVILLQRVRVIQPCVTLLQQVCNDSINHATVEGPKGVRLSICAMKHVQCGYYSLWPLNINGWKMDFPSWLAHFQGRCGGIASLGCCVIVSSITLCRHPYFYPIYLDSFHRSHHNDMLRLKNKF